MPRTPRVAITLTQCWHEVPGGTATSLQRLVDQLARSEQVELVGVGARGDLRRPASWRRQGPPGEWRPPIALRQLPLPLPVLYDAWSRTGRPRIQDTTGPVDLVHLTVPMTPPADEVPLVATVHDLFPLTRPEMMTGRGARLMTAGLRTIRDRAARIMVPSSSVAEDCERHGVDPARVRVVPWGVAPVTVTEADVERVRRRHGLRGPYVLFVGTLEPRKNLAGLLDAMVRLSRPALTLVLVGPSGWGDAFAGPTGVGVGAVPSPVVQLGRVPEADLAALQHGAEVFCFPSLAEGFGLPVLEAMAAGAVVLTSSGTATAEVAGDGAVLVDPRDPAALAAALGELLDDHERRDELRVRARQRSLGFTWQRAADATLEVYREALA
jgi:glycosyltransferase involved in cell wall biosynthesis